MKKGLLIAVIAAALAVGMYMVDIEMTEGASLPDVDVSVEGGALPEFEVETGDVEIETTEITTEVPTLTVETPEEANQVAESK